MRMRSGASSMYMGRTKTRASGLTTMRPQSHHPAARNEAECEFAIAVVMRRAWSSAIPVTLPAAAVPARGAGRERSARYRIPARSGAAVSIIGGTRRCASSVPARLTGCRMSQSGAGDGGGGVRRSQMCWLRLMYSNNASAAQRCPVGLQCASCGQRASLSWPPTRTM